VKTGTGGQLRFRKSEIDVLRYLTRFGSTHKQGLRKYLGLGYATIHEAVGHLEEGGMIKTVKEEKWRTGLIKRTYDITLVGLISVLALNEVWWDSQEIIEIVRRRSDMLPLIFGKWDYFRKRD